MRIRPGRTRSLVAGIAALVVMVIGLVMMTRSVGPFGGPGGIVGPFIIAWVVIALVGAGLAFYNAFSRRGISLYEIDMEEDDDASFCPQCGKPVDRSDEFCRHCGARIDF